MNVSAAPDAAHRLVVFDLDGTLTRHDTLLPYLGGFALRHPRRWPRLWRLLPAALDYLMRGRDRGRLKARVIRAVMGGEDRRTVDAWSETFVQRLNPSRTFHAAALAALAAHRSKGDRLVLLSASPDLYVPRIGRRLGFERTVCTEVRFEGERLEGSLLTANRRGEEKVACLAALRALYPGHRVVAYGNSASDLPLLAQADRGVLVNGGGRLDRAAVAQGVAVARWT